MKLRRALPWLVAAYFVATIACNAYLWHEQLSLRALEYRRFDYEFIVHFRIVAGMILADIPANEMFACDS